MKTIIKVLLLTIFAAGNTLKSLGQISATATVSATIITPISITKNVDMSFGNVSVSAANAGTAILSPATRSTGGAGGVTLPATTGTVAAASFTIAGQANYTYAITLPTVCIINDGSGNTMTGNTFTSSPAVSGILSSFGSQVLNIGATLSLSAAQHPGSYTNATGLPVTVNYN